MKDSLYILPVLGLILSGCGQPGPLYLPGDKPPIYVAPEPKQETKAEPAPNTPAIPQPETKQPVKEQ